MVMEANVLTKIIFSCLLYSQSKIIYCILLKQQGMLNMQKRDVFCRFYAYGAGNTSSNCKATRTGPSPKLFIKARTCSTLSQDRCENALWKNAISERQTFTLFQNAKIILTGWSICFLLTAQNPKTFNLEWFKTEKRGKSSHLPHWNISWNKETSPF